ncbi:MAG: response regulator [Alphaproteobacteria bacterium]|nr:response regulator [Alphaproteobacteria bacterium]
MASPRILLIEDDPISAKLASNLLSELNATVTIVCCGEEAVALFEKATPLDLVLTDLYLPDISGFAVADRIRTTEHYRNRRIPIIALTSNALMESKADFLKNSGFSDYITKPLRKNTFPDIIRHHLNPPGTAQLGWQ